jgi:hypothetical protein
MKSLSGLKLSAHMPTRRTVLRSGVAACAAPAVPSELRALAWKVADGRPSPANRKFTSPVIESVISDTRRKIADPVPGSMFERCFPNTLDTTVFPGTFAGRPSTLLVFPCSIESHCTWQAARRPSSRQSIKALHRLMFRNSLLIGKTNGSPTIFHDQVVNGAHLAFHLQDKPAYQVGGRFARNGEVAL